MAGYLGATPVPQATQHRESFTATAAQTTFATAGYTVGFVDVYLNGVHLTPADVTATNGSDVVLGACLVNDIVDVISHSAFELNAQTFTGTTTLDGAVVINESSADVDFRVESNGQANMLVVNGGDDLVSITPNAATLNIRAGSDDATNNIRLEASGTTSTYLEYRGYLGHIWDVNTTEAMRINAIGAVTMPLQPAFQVNPASNQNNIAINSDVTVVLGTEIFDQNADFASNTFTAPVTGKYQFNASTRINSWDVSANYYQLYIVTSNRRYISTWDAALHASTDHDYITLTLSTLADMDANDTSLMQIFQSGGAAQADIQTQTTFSGYLAC